MSYSQFFTNKKEIKIPTLLSFLLVGLTVFFVARFFLGNAGSSRATRQDISRVEITNVFPNQATIYWQTTQKTIGWIVYGNSENRLDKIALDQKDENGNKSGYINHYMVLQNLQENTKYFFKIVADNKLIGKDNESSFVFNTIDNKIEVNNLQPIYGKIMNNKGKPIENAVVLLFINDAYSLSALSKNSGEWLIPLNYIINKKDKQLKTLSKSDILRIQIVDEDLNNSNITANLSSLSPLKNTVIIGNDYNLLKGDDVLSATSDNKEVSSIDIIFPRENATIPGGNPLIKGKAVPNNILKIISKDGKSTTSIQTKANGSGIWQVTLPQNLAPGAHQLTLQTNDINGNKITKVRNFVIAKSGEKVLGEATDSATPTTAETPTATPTETIPTPTIPVSGGNITAIGLTSAALVLVGLGLLVIF